jgi:hypothetical protein
MRIELTTPDGRHFEIDPDKIDTLEEAEAGLMAPSVKSILYIGGRMQGVRETVDQIKKLEGRKS